MKGATGHAAAGWSSSLHPSWVAAVARRDGADVVLVAGRGRTASTRVRLPPSLARRVL